MKASQRPYRQHYSDRENKHSKDKSWWSRVESIVKTAGQLTQIFLAAIGVLGALAAGAAVYSISAEHFIKGIPLSRLAALSVPSLIERIYSVLAYELMWYMLSIIVLLVIIGSCIGWSVFEITKKLSHKPLKPGNISLRLIIIIAGLILAEVLGEWSYIVALLIGIATISFYYFIYEYKGRFLAKTQNILTTLALVILILMIMMNVTGLVGELIFYTGTQLGWMRGTQEICDSPQITFELKQDIPLEDTMFLSLRSNDEYYVFTTTITTTLSSFDLISDPLIQWLLQTPSKLQACSPAGVTIIPANLTSSVTLTYENQAQPGPCCQSMPLDP